VLLQHLTMLLHSALATVKVISMVLDHKMIMGMVPAKASLNQIVKVQDQH